MRFRLACLTLSIVMLPVAGCSGEERRPAAQKSPSPVPSQSGDPAGRAAAIAAKLGDKDLVGQVLMPFAYGNGATKVSKASAVANRKAFGVDTPAAAVRRHRLGGMILVRQSADPTDATNPTSNVESPAQVRKLTAGLQRAAAELPAAHQAGESVPLLVGTDQEHGVVTRIRDGMTLLPTAMGFGAAADPDLTERAWGVAGAELAAVGVNVDFAPDADVIGPAGNVVIGSRSHGSDPKAVGEQVSAAVRGLQGAGVAATLKHFPGHGHTTTDSHEALPVLAYGRKALKRDDLPPFQAGSAAGAWLVMSGHLDVRAIDPGVTATFSRKVLVDLLRGQVGFDGVVVSDALNMAPARAFSTEEAAVRALRAGNDLLLMPPDVRAAQRGLLAALTSGKLSRERLVEAVTRVLTLKLRLAAFDRPALSTVDSAAHHEVAGAAAAGGVTVLRGRCDGALVSGPVRVTGGADQQRAWLSSALEGHGMTVGSGGARIHLTGYGDGPGDLARDAAVTVGMDAPYLLGRVKSPTVLAAFGANRFSMRAAAAALAGKATAPGRSPVPIQGLPRTACR
ncbi:MAG: glycoside hydrolase family 3 [Micromonosporaceae bacterium]|nr:glycoside hydrolase family 3 [Micromonosporaceae bacterium]